MNFIFNVIIILNILFKGSSAQGLKTEYVALNTGSTLTWVEVKYPVASTDKIDDINYISSALTSCSQVLFSSVSSGSVGAIKLGPWYNLNIGALVLVGNSFQGTGRIFKSTV